MSFSARAQKFPDRPGARPANSLEVSRTKKHNNFLEKNLVKTGEIIVLIDIVANNILPAGRGLLWDIGTILEKKQEILNSRQYCA
jgi:hypothetical protein